MSGHASPIDLAGVAIGTSIWIPVSTGLTGILMATTQLLRNSLDPRKRRCSSRCHTGSIFSHFR